MNHVMLIGRIVRDLEMKEVSSKGYVINNVLAVNRIHRGPNGEEHTDFIPFVVWNSQAQLLEKYCQKGHLIAIYGRMQSRSYRNKEDQIIYVVECIVNEVQLLPNANKKLTSEQEYSQMDQLTPQDREVVEEIVHSMKEKEK